MQLAQVVEVAQTAQSVTLHTSTHVLLVKLYPTAQAPHVFSSIHSMHCGIVSEQLGMQVKLSALRVKFTWHCRHCCRLRQTSQYCTGQTFKMQTPNWLRK